MQLTVSHLVETVLRTLGVVLVLNGVMDWFKHIFFKAFTYIFNIKTISNRNRAHIISEYIQI